MVVVETTVFSNGDIAIDLLPESWRDQWLVSLTEFAKTIPVAPENQQAFKNTLTHCLWRLSLATGRIAACLASADAYRELLRFDADRYAHHHDHQSLYGRREP